MMIVSTKDIYSLSALFELALAYGKRCVRIKEIAKEQGIPEDYLRQILPILKKAGLIESIRGAHGGYKLTRQPSKITVREIFETVSGSMKLVSDDVNDDTLRKYLAGREEEIKTLFDQRLEGLIEERQKAENNIAYYI